ncbi:MAG: Dyp-type peroxidase [Isosphaeraceae bacterium]
MTEAASVVLELDDIQSGVLRPRPSPYAATYVLLNIDDVIAGRELMRRAAGVVNSAAAPSAKTGDVSISIALTFQGLKALGVPPKFLDSFPPEFQRGMAARAAVLGDTGESAPEHWEKPLGTPDVHAVLGIVAPSSERLEAALAQGRKAYEGIAGVRAIWRQDCYSLPTDREHFGYRDGIGQPPIEGSGIPGNNPGEEPLKAGEFVLGYRDEMGNNLAPTPDVLGKNGSFIVFRKLRQRVAAYRKFLKTNVDSPEAEELLAAKMMGRWRSGAPLTRCPMHDDAGVAADATLVNDFMYRADDPRGLKTPIESHIRRMNPRDSEVIGIPRLHRMLRRGTVYGPPLPEGVLEDDGADRGFMYTIVVAHIDRQFEFIQKEWMNSGEFAGRGDAKDPIAGANNGTETFTIPERPIRRCVESMPRFVVTRGGEYAFLPGLRALKWLADPDTKS